MGMKRGNGTGTVYKMKHKPLRKPYRAVITQGWTDEGKAIRKTIGTFEKAKDAWDALARYHADPTQFEAKKVTFGQCWQWLLEDKQRAGIGLTAYKAVEGKIQHIMKINMQDIRTALLQHVIDDNIHMSGSYLESIKTALSGAFKVAMKNDIVSKNYASLIVLPPRQKSTIHKPFTASEIGALWANTEAKIAKLALIYIYTGMRPVELRKIKRADVHLKESYMIGGVKTQAGRDRVIPIADCIRPFISELYALSQFMQSELLVPAGYVAKSLVDPLARLCDDLHITQHLPHDCRHTFVTMASNQGIDEHTLKLIIGHSQSGITDSVYVHKTRQQLIDAVNSLPHHGELVKSCATVEQQR